jgi:hypothetical protein
LNQQRFFINNPQAVATRWNSTLLLLQSVSSNWTELRNFADAANEKNALRKALLEIDITLLNEIIDVLNPFHEATKIASADKVPTIHLVVAMRLKLLSSVAESAENSDPIRQLKNQLTIFLTSHFRVSPLHRIALLLDPRQKNNRSLMSPEERMECITEIKAMVSDVWRAEADEGPSISAGSLSYDILHTFCYVTSSGRSRAGAAMAHSPTLVYHSIFTV